ncbi:DDB1- and CUL4-associated factor 13-like isoform X2 [Hylaeus volcanicus]|uniref:DDB1- and CUL4-associated factor 13-like isoform X2 n=1 Tax=Hylaeus volcanicus TaxID=313075 RepID=UPI0023B7D275|nr:DDB1- and CUL4-associated factor 13-like isoform X2 [Hylaeus volcanicus]
MKVKILHRDVEEYDQSFREKGALRPTYRNPDPRLHPLENAHEIQRAIVAAKMEKMFSKPLVAVLDGHRDAVRCIARCHNRLSDIFTGSCDGEIRHWSLSQKRCLRSIKAHEGFVQDISVSHDNMHLLSCGDDGVVRAWQFNALTPVPSQEDIEDTGHLVQLDQDDTQVFGNSILAVKTWTATGPLTSVDHHWKKPLFLTTGETLELWDTSRSSPISSYEWGNDCDGLYHGCFNKADTNLLASSGRDNSVCIFDIRSQQPVSRFILKMRTNHLCWNPMQPLLFTCANEDSNLYTFDIRRLDAARVVHKDFTNAVLDVDYSPTGREFVAASADRTLRIFPSDKGRSREIYHGKRMQLVLSCSYSADARFVISGSADFCVRVWKNKAWDSLGPKSQREKRTLAYREALKERYKHIPQVRRILNHRHIPKLVKLTSEKKAAIHSSRQRAEMNRQLNSKLDSTSDKDEKKRAILKVEDS